MEQFLCNNCGSNDFVIKDGYKICKFCRSKYKINLANENNTNITVNEDVVKLFKKIEENPEKADRYARLILEIDSDNVEAKKYIKKTSIW